MRKCWLGTHCTRFYFMKIYEQFEKALENEGILFKLDNEEYFLATSKIKLTLQKILPCYRILVDDRYSKKFNYLYFHKKESKLISIFSRDAPCRFGYSLIINGADAIFLLAEYIKNEG